MFRTLRNLFTGLMASHVQLHESETCRDCGSKLAQDADGWGESPREPRVVSSEGGSPGDSPHQPAVWHCPNPDCPPQLLRRVALWASAEAMDIEGCDAALVAQLVRTGLVHDAAEFYSLKVSEIASLDGMDLARARVLWDAIDASRKRDAWRVLVGLGIPGIGAAEAKVFCAHVKSLEDLFAMGRERLVRYDGVTDEMARNLTRWYSDSTNRGVIRRLDKAGVNFNTAF